MSEARLWRYPTWNKESRLEPLFWKRAVCDCLHRYPRLTIDQAAYVPTLPVAWYAHQGYRRVRFVVPLAARSVRPCHRHLRAHGSDDVQVIRHRPRKVPDLRRAKDRLFADRSSGLALELVTARQYSTIIGYLPTWREKIIVSDRRPQRQRDDAAHMELVRRLACDEASGICSIATRRRSSYVGIPNSKGATLSPPFFHMDDTDGDATHLLQECDVIIGDYSSVVIDALLFDRPLALWCEDFETYTSLRPLPYFRFSRHIWLGAQESAS